MNPNLTNASATDPLRRFDDPRVAQALEEYLAGWENGEPADRAAFLARHADIADILAECLGGLDLVQQAQPCFDSPGGGGAAVALTPEAPLGDYRLVREVGRGGMGVVYEAVQVSLGRRVALKVLPFAGALDPRQLVRFKNEAMAAASLHHPHIVPIHAVGCDRGVHYYAMQLIDGQPLTAVIAGLRGRPTYAAAETVGRLSTQREHDRPAFYRAAARLGRQAAEALDHAHQLGIVHRDVKPGNLLVDGRGDLWVTDFGLAQMRADGTRLTQTGDLLGTLRYMSPEQVLGQPAQVDPRGDIYSLGATLYELLTLEPAVTGGDRAEVLAHIAFAEPIPPRQHEPGIPVELETVVLKALAKNPADRYASAAELADDLARFLDDRPIRARRPTVWQRLARWARRYRPLVLTAALAGATLLVLGLVGLGISHALLSRAHRDTLHAKRERDVQLWHTWIAHARALRLTSRAGGRAESQRLLRQAARSLAELELAEEDVLQLRNEWIATSAVPADLRLLRETTPASPFPVGTALAPDHRLYAVGDRDGTVSVRRVDDQQEVYRAPGPGRPCWRMTFSAEGRYLALRHAGAADRGGSFRVIDLRHKQLLVPPTEMPRHCCAADFTPDGRWLAYGQGPRTIVLLDLTTGGRRELTLDLAPAPPHCLRFAPDGQKLAVTFDRRDELHVVDATTGTREVIVQHPMLSSDAIAWSPDGGQLAVTCHDHCVRLFTFIGRTGYERKSLPGHRGHVVQVAFSPGGDLIMTSSSDGTTRLWDAVSGLPLVSSAGGQRGLAFAGQGRQLTFASPVGGGVWEVELSRIFQHFLVPQGPVQVSAAADDRLLACACRDGVRVLDRVHHQEVALFRIAAGDTALFLPDGCLLTGGPAGAHRWRLQPDPKSGTLSFEYLRPVFSAVRGASCRLALCPDGRFVAGLAGSRLLVGDWLGKAPIELPGDYTAAGWLAVSPNGAWVATAADKGRGVAVWDVARRRIACPDLWPELEHGCAAFDPTGRWLVIGGLRGYRLWEVGSWRPVWQTARGPANRPGPAAFAPDGSVLAVSLSAGAVRLVEPATGRTFATLESPFARRIDGLCFSGDGGRLIVLAELVELWDLREMRRELAPLGLDWGLPPYPPARTVPPRGRWKWSAVQPGKRNGL